MDQNPQPFWSIPAAETIKNLQTKDSGLTTSEAQKRLISYGANRLKPKKRSDVFSLLISQFNSPIILILLFATGLSFFLHNLVDATIILIIVIVSGLLGFWQEHGIRRFGYFLGEVTLVLVVIIFAINVYLQRPVLDSFLFYNLFADFINRDDLHPCCRNYQNIFL